MNKNKTLYISDLDGTLLNQSAKLSEYTKTSINTMITNGLNFSVATARLPDPVRKMLVDVKVSVPVILLNGVLIYDIMQDYYIKISKLLPETVAAVINEIKKFEITAFMYKLNNGKLSTYHEIFEKNPIDNYIKDRIDRHKSFCPINGFSSISPENVIYFTLIGTNEQLQIVHDVFAKLPDLNQSLYKNIYTEDMWYLEVFSINASKQNAVNYLREAYGFECIISFGDNTNDLPMFAACDICVAVENATEEIKTIADYICDTNENDGVAKWLEENYDTNSI